MDCGYRALVPARARSLDAGAGSSALRSMPVPGSERRGPGSCGGESGYARDTGDHDRALRLPLAAGDPARALAQPESIVLSRKIARKLFGSSDPIGRTLTVNLDHNRSCGANDTGCLDASYPLTVTGVLRDLPHNTQLAADMVIPNTS